MSEIKKNPNMRYLRENKLPHFFCAGCGNGQIMNYFTQAMDELGCNIDEMVMFSGVGCAARIPVYMKVDEFHGIHGRTLAWATGVRLMMPDTPIVVFAGDGDTASIGGNHFIHACRRNLNVTMVMVNNLNFAMTGGQVAPTTPEGSVTMTTPYGSAEPRFDVCNLAIAAGASHVERWTTCHPKQCVAAFKRGMQHKGFSFIEIVSQCPTNFGRYALKTGDPLKVREWIKENTYDQAKGKKMSEEERAGKLELGEFMRIEGRPCYSGTNNPLK